ncbi:MAG: sensor histidine kinase [Myxococcota bacterium]
MSQPAHTMPEALVQSLRAAAARSSELAGGAPTLVFAAEPGSDPAAAPSLRAAAGFPSPDAARAGASALNGAIQDAMASGRSDTIPAPPSLAESCSAGLAVAPLAFAGRVRGVMVVGLARSLDPRASQMLGQIAGSMGLQLDHMHLGAELEALRAAAPAPAPSSDDPDELLKLSEQLFAQDIELMRRDEKLGKIEKLKNDFIEKMSRELRTPLNNIIEAIISVIAGENDRLSDSSVEGLRRALDEGTAFQRTLQNIIDLWRIKQNELPLEMQEVNFAEVVEEAIFSVQDTLGEKAVSIEKEFKEALPKVRTDLAKVNQLLFLLLDNAAKYTEAGTITIAPEIVGDELVCEVRDTGIGICPDDQGLVFDEFFQVDDMASTRYRGAGLGLALVRDLLTLMGGEIQVRSEAGKGTSMTFRIPVQVL